MAEAGDAVQLVIAAARGGYLLAKGSYLLLLKMLQLTQATNFSILVSSAPIISILLMRFFHQGDRLSPRKLIGIVLAFLGVLLVVFNGVFVLKLNPVGDALALMAALFWALYGFLAKPILEKHESALITRKLMFYGPGAGPLPTGSAVLGDVMEIAKTMDLQED